MRLAVTANVVATLELNVSVPRTRSMYSWMKRCFKMFGMQLEAPLKTMCNVNSKTVSSVKWFMKLLVTPVCGWLKSCSSN